MVEYDFYVSSYLGSQIPESAFAGVERQARSRLEKIENCCRVQGGQEARAMAICAMAEVLWRRQQHPGVRSSTVGGVSVSYETPGTSLSRELFLAAEVFLDIYRGVKA